MNEPYEMLASTPWVNIAQACINAIRTIDTKTTIIVSGDEFSSARRWKESSILSLSDINSFRMERMQ